MTAGTDTDVDRVLLELESDSPAGRRDAVLAAVRLGERAVRAIPLLQRMASDEVIPELRHLARKGLHLLAQEAHAKAQANQQAQALTAQPGGKSAKITQELAKESIPVVAAKLNSSNPHVRASALRATAMRGEKLLLPALMERLGPEREPDPELRAIQVRVLAILGGKEHMKGVAGFLEDPDPTCRTAAVDVLAQFRDVSAFPFIVRSLQDPDPRCQARAAAALTKVGAVNILKICELMIASDRAWSRDAAAFCLALTGLPDSARLLEGLLGDSEESVRRKARLGLVKLVEKGVDAAKEVLARQSVPREPAPPAAPEAPAPVVETAPAADIESREPSRRRIATKQLVALDGALDESHLPGIMKRLDGESDGVTLVNLITAIGRIKSPTAILALAKSFVSHPDETVRAATVDALAAIGTPEALEPVRPLLADPSPVVLGRSLVALKNHEKVDVVEELTRMASHADALFRTTAVYVITELGDERLVPAIEKLARDSDPGVASLAQDSSEILAEDLRAKALQRKTKAATDPGKAPTRPATTGKSSGVHPRPTRPTPASGASPQVGAAPAAEPLKAPAALIAAGGLGWMGVAAWYLAGETIQTAHAAGAGLAMLAGLGGLGVGYGLLKKEAWSGKAGMGIAALQVLLALAQVAFGRPAALVLALIAGAGGALLYQARAVFE